MAVHGLAILLGRNEAGISNRGKIFFAPHCMLYGWNVNDVDVGCHCRCRKSRVSVPLSPIAIMSLGPKDSAKRMSTFSVAIASSNVIAKLGLTRLCRFSELTNL